jgi:Ca2+-binding RTX toxin-like protein
VALNVTTVAVPGLSIATGSGSNSITASALTVGQTLSLTGGSAATVTLNAGNLSAASYSGNITVTGGVSANTITVGSGGSTITGGGGADMLNGGTGNDIFNFGSAANLGAAASIAGGLGSDTIQMTAAATVSDGNFPHATSIETLGLTGASTVTLGSNASTAGISNVVTGAGATSITDSNGVALNVNATALANNTALTLVGSAAETVTGLIGDIAAGSLTGTLNVATGDATDNTISITTGSAATSITDAFASDTVTVNATALADNTALILSGAAGFTVTGLQGDLTASSVSGALNVTTVDVASGLSIATGSGSDTITATALKTGHTLTLTGSSAATVTLNAGNQSGSLSAGTYTGNITVTGGTGANTITGGAGADTITGNGGADIITGNGGADTMSGGSGVDTYVYNATSDSTVAIHDTITNFGAGADIINTSAIAGITLLQGLITGSTSISAHSIAWIQSGANTLVYANATAVAEAQGSADMEIVLTGVTASTLTNGDFTHAPAGVSGHAIDLALTDPSGGEGNPVTVTITGAPSDWSLNAGTNLGTGTWTVQTSNPAALTITPAATFMGAMLLGVTESWTNPDGSTASAFIMDNVEAYAPGAPIFAVSSNDTLTGTGGNDLFVFGQPIGNDTIYNFNAASDKIDLIGFNTVTSFSDIKMHLTDGANGDAVITLGDGQSITLHGIDAASLTAGDFVFDQTPVTDNVGNIVLGDDAMLPLSGTINNTGTIALSSTGHETDLQLIGHGMTLEGGGQVLLSDSSQNFISGTDPSVTLTNVDNTISGAGHLGNGQLTLINEGTIDANGTHPLIVDTGANPITNSGTLEATGSGGLIIDSDVVNSGTIWANESNVAIHGDVSGHGSATISGNATLEFAGADSGSVSFQSSTGTLQLDHSSSFTGTITGFGGDGTLAGSDHIDLQDINFNSLQPAQLSASGVLTISDGAHTAHLQFDGSYQLENFKFADDGSPQHGTIVYDPPVVAAQPSPTVSPSESTAAHSGAFGTPGSDTFAFNHDFGRDIISQSGSGHESVHSDQSIAHEISDILTHAAQSSPEPAVADHGSTAAAELKEKVMTHFIDSQHIHNI